MSNNYPYIGSLTPAENYQDALLLKEDKVNKGVADGYAPLDANAKVPAANLPDSAALDAEVATQISAHNSSTTSVHGIANTANLVLTNDARLSDARTPTAHASTHRDNGDDVIYCDAALVSGTGGSQIPYNGVYYSDGTIVGGRPIFYKRGSSRQIRIEYSAQSERWTVFNGQAGTRQSTITQAERPWQASWQTNQSSTFSIVQLSLEKSVLQSLGSIPAAGGALDFFAEISAVDDEQRSTTLSPDGLILGNSSSLKEGASDFAGSQTSGIALKADGYELKWLGSRLFAMGSNGTTIRSVGQCDVSPGVDDDEAKGFVAGSIWSMVDGTVYECIDPEAGNAVWSLKPPIAHTHPNATTSANGFMSSADKAKLDGLGVPPSGPTISFSGIEQSTNWFRKWGWNYGRLGYVQFCPIPLTPLNTTEPDYSPNTVLPLANFTDPGHDIQFKADYVQDMLENPAHSLPLLAGDNRLYYSLASKPSFISRWRIKGEYWWSQPHSLNPGAGRVVNFATGGLDLTGYPKFGTKCLDARSVVRQGAFSHGAVNGIATIADFVLSQAANFKLGICIDAVSDSQYCPDQVIVARGVPAGSGGPLPAPINYAPEISSSVKATASITGASYPKLVIFNISCAAGDTITVQFKSNLASQAMAVSMFTFDPL